MILASRFVSQAVLIGNERKFPAALIVPNFDQLDSYAKIKGIRAASHSEYCSDPRIIHLFERQIERHTKELSGFEKVKAFALIEREFTVEGGELTPTLKVKRRVIDEKYRHIIDRLYSEAENKKPGI
jgi:long-chain acyl-CoA synthetase